MNRSILYAALAGVVVVPVARATQIESFDSPNLLQDPAKNGNSTNYRLIKDSVSYLPSNATVQETFGSTFWEISTTPLPGKPGYGSGYHNIYSQNKPPPGSPLTNGVIDISGNNMLQLDVTINNGTGAGLFIDLMDGQGDFWQYFYGYGLTGNAANDTPNAAPGVTITQGALPNEEILRVPLATPHLDIFETGSFDFSQVTLYRIENDPGTPAGGTGNPSDTSFYDLSAVNIVVGGSVWNFNGSGDWNTGGNWANSTVPNGVGAEADFFGVITSAATVSTAVPVTAGLLNFNNANSYTIGGAGSLTLQTSSGNAQVIVQAGTQKINVPLTVASSTVFNVASGTSLQILSPLTINAGQSVTQTGTGTVSYQSSISVLSGGSITFGNASHATGLSLAATATAAMTPRVSGGPVILQLDSLTFAAPSSKLDVSNQELLVTATPATVRGELQAGNLITTRNGGKLGYKDVGGGVTEVLFTLAGDTDLSSNVDVGDLGALATSYGVTGGALWSQGDFNYDGNVDVGDLGALATNYGQSAGLGTGAAGPASEISVASSVGASVPEPTSIGVVGVAASFLALRRRRNG